jgi:hypothetical protein
LLPPVWAVHTESKVAGSRVNITFGWITMSIRGIINKANEMEEPAEGWTFVEARFRDEAEAALVNKRGVDKGMVMHSEALSCLQSMVGTRLPCWETGGVVKSSN